MINQQLVNYIKEQVQRGVSREEIEKALLAIGWQATDIKEAFDSLSFSAPIKPTIPESPLPQSLKPSDVQSQPVSFYSPQKPNRISSIILSVVGGLLIIGGGVFAYFYYFQSPAKIVQKMMIELSKVTSLEYSGEIIAEMSTGNFLEGETNLFEPVEQSQGKKETRSSITFSGSSDAQDLNSQKGQFSFKIKTDALLEEEFTFGLEMRIIDEIIYAQLSNAPNLGFFDLSSFENQWIRIDIKELEEQFGADLTQELTQEEIEKIKNAVQQSKVFKITDKLAGENIEGVNTYHYKFSVDRTGLKKLIIDVDKIIAREELDEEIMVELDKGIDELFETMEILEGEIWIGKKDFLPYKIKFSSTVKETEEVKLSGNYNFTFSMKNFNEPIQVDVPQGAKSLEEFLETFLGGSQGFFGDNPLEISEKDRQELEAAVFAAVDGKTKGKWDKEIEILSVNDLQDAAEGLWWKEYDQQWIAWKKSDEKWNVLVSVDLFSCNDLKALPAQHEDFFYDVIYDPLGEKYCRLK